MLLGKGKQVISLGLFLFFFLSAPGQDGRYFRYKLNGDHETSHVFSPDGSIILNYSISELNLESNISGNGTFYRISIPGHIPSSVPGEPELPVYSKLITIPEGSDYRIRITEVESKKINPRLKKFTGVVYPAQPSQAKIFQKEKTFLMKTEAYSKRGTMYSDTVRIEPLGRVRNNNLANLYVFPVHYNPLSNVIEVITSMRIEVIFSTSGTFAKSLSTQSTLFDQSLSKGILNYNRDLIPGFTDKPAGMLILTDTAFRKPLEPFLQWKRQKGFNLKVLYKGAAFAGTTYTEIKNSISDIYSSATEDDPAPDYLLIIGDVNRIPYREGSIGTDMYYGEFDGNNDYIPEMYVGRLPVKDTSELLATTRKIIQYEKFQFADTNSFHSRALVTAGYDVEWTDHMNGQINYSVANYLTESNNIDEYHFNHPQPGDNFSAKKDSIIGLFNDGISFLNYSGHGSVSGWMDPDVMINDVALLNNKSMYPFIISNACYTSRFYNSTNSFGNTLVMEKEKGAIGFIGSAMESYWDEDYYWAVGLGDISPNPSYDGKGLGIFDRLFHTHYEYPSDWYFTIGQINYAGNLSVSASNSGYKQKYWETYNIVGDPSIIPIIGTPGSFNISLPDTLPNSIRSLSMIIDPFSYIAVSHFDTLWDASFGTTSGSVTMDMPGLSDDSCLFVLTGQNKRPLIKTVYFSDINNEFLNLSSTDINDASGNNDGKADYGENFYLKLSVKNLGLTDANNVRALISTSSEWLIIENDSTFIGTLNGQSEIVLSDKLLVKVSENVPDRGIATIDLILRDQMTEKQYKIDVVLHSPVLNITGCIVDDTKLGNGDYTADPGEKFHLVFRVLNEGSSDATGDLTVSSTATGISIESVVESGILKSGMTTNIPVSVELPVSFAPGTFIPVSSTLNCNPYIISKDFAFRVGKLRESFEISSFDVFPWMNFSQVPWKIISSNSIDGSFSAQSGAITHNGNTTLKIRAYYSENDTLKFYYKVSSEKSYDLLKFRINGTEKLNASGEVPWTMKEVPVEEGYNEMEWEFSMDRSNHSGSDCAWLDLIDFAVKSNINFIQQDLQITGIMSPVQKQEYGKEQLTLNVLNTGKDTINGFNLAYTINDGPQVSQFFNNKINPHSEAIPVTFNSTLDLSKHGTYSIVGYINYNEDEYKNNDTVFIKIEHQKILNVYPNPFDDDFTIILNSQKSDKVRITITNTSGSCLYIKESVIIIGSNEIIIPDSRLIPGLYYLNISGEFFNETVPLIRMNK